VTEFFGRAAEIVVTFEDHVLTGGYGSAVLELFHEKRISTPVARIGWPDQFIEHASSVDWLREKHGLTAAAAAAQVNELSITQLQAEPLAVPIQARG
jgi:1-deoxy-D-xylulose-5-phosphate synthase